MVVARGTMHGLKENSQQFYGMPSHVREKHVAQRSQHSNTTQMGKGSKVTALSRGIKSGLGLSSDTSHFCGYVRYLESGRIRNNQMHRTCSFRKRYAVR